MRTQYQSISKLISSPSIEPLHPSIFRNWNLNRTALKQVCYLFPDFRFKDLTTTSLLNYHNLRSSHQIGDHVNPMKYFSVDLYQQWKKTPEKFRFYKEVLDFKFKGARVLRTDLGIWPQITVEIVHPGDRGYKRQLYVLERKYQALQIVDHWRFRMFPTNDEKKD